MPRDCFLLTSAGYRVSLSLRILTGFILVCQFLGYSYAQCTSVSGSTVPLFWDASPEPNIDNYNVYRSSTSGFGYSVIGTAPQSPDTSTFTDATPLSTGYYTVTAVNGSGLESSFSDELCVVLAVAPPPPPYVPPPPTNKVPTAVDDSVETKESVAVTINVLSNDSDPDGDSLRVSSSTQPTNGSVATSSDGTVVYTPANAFYGIDSFRYSVSDGKGGSDSASVTVTVTPDRTVLIANFMNGNNGALSSRVYLWNPSPRAGEVTVRVFTLPLAGGTAQELTDTPLNLGSLGAESALNLKLAEDILTPLGTPMPYEDDGGNLTVEFTIGTSNVRGVAQVFSPSLAFGTYPLQEVPSTSAGSLTVLVANFMNGNNGALNSRVYLWNPSATDGRVRVRVFTLPNTGDSMRLQTVPLGILKAFSARNIRIAEDILAFSGIALPYTDDGGNLMLEFAIEAPDVRGVAQVFSSNMAFGTYVLQEVPSTPNVEPAILVAHPMNGNNAIFNSRVYLWNPSASAGEVTVRVFTLSQTGDSSLLGESSLGVLEASSTRNIKLAEDILAPLGIPLPYTDDDGQLTLEFTIESPNVWGTAQVFSSGLAYGTYPLQEIPSTSGPDPTVLVAHFMNGNNEFVDSRVYLWNPSASAGEVTVRVFTLPLKDGTAQELTDIPFDLGTLGAESARNIKLAEDILAPLGIPLPYMSDGGNLTVEITIGAPNVQGVAQVFSSNLAFGTYPLQ